MKTIIRMLNSSDFKYFRMMDTGVKNDYICNIFDHLVTGNNHLYGLFIDEQLVMLGGYTIFGSQFAMLGRLRTDRRFRGRGMTTSFMSHVIENVFQNPAIKWAGANTQENNFPARRVLDKLGFSKQITLHGAVAENISSLTTGRPAWKRISSLERKKFLIDKLYVKQHAFFPVECYYPLPGAPELFPHEKLMQWDFYENKDHTRVLILKSDVKKHTYLHVVYPWSDMMDQPGLWETIAAAYGDLQGQTDHQPYIWMDLTKEEANALPLGHPFELPSPWMLYGMWREEWRE